jgi:DNA-binding NarL/FixJ family response regulator
MNTTDAPIRLLLVDDHTVVREGFAALLSLQPDFEVVGQAGSGQEGIAAYRRLQPDITMMDLSLPDIDGVVAIRTICGEFPHALIAVMTTFDNDERILSAVQAGARTYLIKTVSPDELHRTIRELARQGGDPRKLVRRSVYSGRIPLSQREISVLERMVAGEPNAAIAARLGVSTNTIKSHVRGILHKLQARSRTDAVAMALDLGIVERRARERGFGDNTSLT